MGYGVIGSPADSGSASLGSSPGTPAKLAISPVMYVQPPSSSGLGRRPLKAVTPVRTWSGVRAFRYCSGFVFLARGASSEQGIFDQFLWRVLAHELASPRDL